jgi:hypothetical protein
VTAITVTAFAWPGIAQLAAFDRRSQPATFQPLIELGFTVKTLVVSLRLLERCHSRLVATDRGTKKAANMEQE